VPPRTQIKHIPVGRQIVITNEFVVGTNYAGLKARSPEANPSSIVFFGGGYYTATNLANQIAGTDHIEVKNVFSGIDVETSPITFLLSGEAAKQVVRAVSSGGRFAHQVRPGWLFPEWELQFYKGRKHLASFVFTGAVFMKDMNSAEYTDYSGVLATLYDTAQAAAGE
jgi:hypothetical protein